VFVVKFNNWINMAMLYQLFIRAIYGIAHIREYHIIVARLTTVNLHC